MTNYKKIFIYLFGLILSCMIFGGFTSNAATSAAYDIRVGLKSSYSGKKLITVYNSSVKVGYCINDSYKAELVLNSKNGFSFEADNTQYYYENEYFSSYSAAYKALQNLKLEGKNANICLCGRGKWRLYVSSSNKQSKVSYNTAKTAELIKLTFGNKSLLIDASEASAYPQIKAGDNDRYISLGSKKYRGRIEIGRYGNSGVTAVNIVNLESYLKGVVTCEMNAGWESEALKVQAVCARSYALTLCSFTADSNISKGYSIVDTDASQVYGGVNSETQAAVKAVNATSHEIMTTNGKPLATYYSSTSGGATDFSSDIWGGNSYNFVGVFDEYETDPEKRPWCVSYKLSDLEKRLNAKGYPISGITSIYPEIISDSGRISSLKIKYKGGSISIPGSKLRSLFDLPSTKFRVVMNDSDELFEINIISSDGTEKENPAFVNIISQDGQIYNVQDTATQLIVISSDNMTNFPISKPSENEVWFLGMGSGHGIGMSQSGANGMAKKGFNYKEILYYYYKNAELSKY
ncbi:MAG: SpoIID/LytB domain-containing protein [Lachnospiraceae bacterium]|nr:SpoIID/LytB domain-containing protein [Lachnospiraceae bacterium]